MKATLGIFLFFGLLLAGCNERTVTTDIPGCTDPSSINYNPEATVDDGTCMEPQPKQWGFVLEYTATWCGPCGSSGAPKMHEMYQAGDVVGITCHVDGDPMYNQELYNSFTSCRPTGGGIPSFWVGDQSGGNIGHLNTLMQRNPDAGVVFSSERKGNVMEVKVLSKFFNALSGDYYLSVYILESGIDGTTGEYEQNGTSDPDYKHDFVLRAVATSSNAYGEKIASGNIQAGTSIRKDYSITLDPSWTNDVYVAAVLWKKDSGSGMYEYVNAFEVGNHESH